MLSNVHARKLSKLYSPNASIGALYHSLIINLTYRNFSFVKTGQDDVIDSNNLPAILEGMRNICGLESTLLGNVSGANGYFNSTTTTSLPTPTASASGDLFLQHQDLTRFMGLALFMGIFGL